MATRKALMRRVCRIEWQYDLQLERWVPVKEDGTILGGSEVGCRSGALIEGKCQEELERFTQGR